MKNILYIFIIIAAILFFDSIANAGAWVRDNGEGLGIITLKWYESGESWDKERDLVDSPGYRAVEINPYLEYGVTDELTAGVNIFLIDVNGNGDSGLGLSDVELIARYRLRKADFDVISTQLLLKVPGPLRDDNVPGLGSGQLDIEWRLLYGRGGNFSPVQGSEWYMNAEGGLRKRFGSPADELRVDWAFGWRSPDKKWEAELKQENILGLRNASNPDAPDFDLHKATPSVRCWLNQRLAVQAGYSRDIYGRNTGKGYAVFTGLWFKF